MVLLQSVQSYPSVSLLATTSPAGRMSSDDARTLDRLVAEAADSAVHVTDPSNASRTLLFDLEKGAWSDELCDLFDVTRSALPELVPNSGVVGTTDPDSFLGLSLPIAGMAGDQQAALFGQACFSPGMSKCTYGTGSFVLTNTGSSPVRSATSAIRSIGACRSNALMTASPRASELEKWSEAFDFTGGMAEATRAVTAPIISSFVVRSRAANVDTLL